MAGDGTQPAQHGIQPRAHGGIDHRRGDHRDDRDAHKRDHRLGDLVDGAQPGVRLGGPSGVQEGEIQSAGPREAAHTGEKDRTETEQGE